MYSMVTIVNIMYLKYAKTVDLSILITLKTMDILINMIVVIILQLVCVSSHHIVSFIYIYRILAPNYSSIKQGEKQN